MTRDEYVFYKVSILSLCLGFILGLALGLLVFCPVVHAEQTGVWAYPLGRGEFVETGVACEDERVGDSYLTADHQLMFCYGEKGWNIVNFVEDIPCLATMEAAMRAMDEFVDQKQKDYESYDGCNYCDSRGCTLVACPSGGNEVARLEWELKQAKKKEEAAKQRAVTLKQWEQAKACWRKP